MIEKVFLDKLMKEKNKPKDKKYSEFNNVKYILLDEVHERSVTIDLIMGLLLDLVKLYPKIKVIICSATVNEQLFTTYLNQCKVLHIMGRTYPVEVYY